VHFAQVQKMILLQSIDQHWKEHLQAVDQMREWINLRAYAQKDPLVEYKQEAFKTFEEMNFNVKADAIEKLLKIQLVLQDPNAGLSDSGEAELDHARMGASLNQARNGGGNLQRSSAAASDEEDEDADSTEEALEALRPKQRQRLVYSGGGESSGDAPKASRSARRKQDRDQKKKLF
jgi:preprotein translocase subunit SecA